MLSPYRVLDLTDERGHFAGYLLAALGADVVAVEPPEGMRARRLGPFLDHEVGPDRSLTHFAYNRGKRSVVLDLDSEAGRDSFGGLVDGADVVLESAEPGFWAARGLDANSLLVRNPALVVTSVTAFGQDGPKATIPATDLTVLASSNALVLTGDADRAPVRLVVPQAFLMGSAVAACATVIALIERSRSGLGQHVDVAAQTAAMLASQVSVVSEAIGAGSVRRTAGGAKAGKLDLQLVYPAADGHVSITHVFGPAIGPRTADLMAWACEEGHCDPALRDRDWVNFDVLVDTGVETVDTWEQAKAAVTSLTRSHTKAELFAVAQERRLLLAPIATVDDVAASEQLAFRGFFDKVHHPVAGRAITVPGAFAKFSATPLQPLSPAPALGEHTAALLAEPRRRPSVPTTKTPAPEPGRPLAGVKVLDFTWSIAGPQGTRVLADCGATVIKVETASKPDGTRGYRPTYNGQPGLENSALFDTMNAGKHSITLDLNNPASRPVVLDLVRWADVVVESYSPRAMRRWQLDYAHLREVNPRLVMASTCLTGQDGPLSSFAGYGNLAAALSGFYGLAGWPDRAPAGPFGAYTDYTSTHLVNLSVLAALEHQRRTGQGQYIDVAQAEAALHYLSPALVAHAANGTIASRQGNRDADLAPHGVYPAAGEDRWVALACQDDDAWPRLCAAIGRPDLAANPALAHAEGRHRVHDELDELLTAWTATRTPEDIESVLQGAGVAAHTVNNSAECVADPQLQARGHLLHLDHPDRACLVESTRFRMSRTAPEVGLPPRRGAHTDWALREVLGYDDATIAALRAANALS